MSKDNGLEYIRKTYGVPAYRGVQVDTGSEQWGVGVITGNDGPYVRIRCKNGEACFHPTDRLTYFIETQCRSDIGH